MVALIWLYTRRGGIKTLVITDTFQTLCLFLALSLIIYKVTSALDLTIPEAIRTIADSKHSEIFVFNDWMSKQNFWKQFISGIFIVIVMTGLDQDMMQKNLTCRTLREAQKDMCTYGFAFLPVNLLFLALGTLLVFFFSRQSQPLPTNPDDLMLLATAGGWLGSTVVSLFTIGVVAASFSSADSALTALTTTYCVDLRERPNDEPLRRRAHLVISVIFVIFILAFRLFNSTSLIDAVYIICSYTYGPLLGLFAFGLLTKYQANDRLVPHIAILSPLLCFVIEQATKNLTGYHFGYELLMLNGFLTFVGLFITRRR